ncbi:MAG: hypothetical protein ACRDOB_22265 [Streptosporangiaceae bacterium]
MIAAIVSLRPAVRRRAAVLLLPAFVTTTLACWGFQGVSCRPACLSACSC